MMDGDGSGEGSGTETATDFQIRVTHLSSDAPAVDVYVGDDAQPTIAGLAFADGTLYLTLPSGVDYTFNVRVAGSEATSDPVLVQQASPAGGDVLNVVAIGRLGGDPEPLETAVVVEDLTAPMEGMIRVQAVHAAPTAGEVDIYNIPAEGEPVQIVSDLAYGTASGYLEIPAGAYQLGIDINNDPGTLELVYSTSEIDPGEILSIFAMNNEAGDEVVLLIQNALSDEILLRADGAN